MGSFWYTVMDPELPTYPTLLMYTEVWAFDDDHDKVAPPPYALGLGMRETEQLAGLYAYAVSEQVTGPHAGTEQ